MNVNEHREHKTSKKIPAVIAVIIIFALIAAAVFLFTGHMNKTTSQSTDISDRTVKVTAGILKDEEFGGILIDIGIEEFNSHGFDFGDSVKVSFKNGDTLDNIPYYSGYYGSIGDLLLCGYPGSANVAVKRSYGDDTWEEFTGPGIDSVTVTLMERVNTSISRSFIISPIQMTGMIMDRTVSLRISVR